MQNFGKNKFSFELNHLKFTIGSYVVYTADIYQNRLKEATLIKPTTYTSMEIAEIYKDYRSIIHSFIFHTNSASYMKC